MILVTAGTTLPFDDLIRTVDGLAAKKNFAEKVVCQIGHGTYLPAHCDYFRFHPNFEEFVEQASLVIGHGGTGTVTELLASGKPFVAVANPLGVGNHQVQFLSRLSKIADFLWTDDLDKLEELIENARSFVPKTAGTVNSLADDLRMFLMDAK